MIENKEDIKIRWMGEDRPQDIGAAEAQILKELDELMDEDQHLNELIFHTVFLNPLTMDADSIMVEPSEDDPLTIECTFYPLTQWVSLNDLDS